MNSSKTQADQSSYRSSFVATMLFSGVQIYQIIIRIIKSKFVALFLGPTGMGITSLLRSTTDTISAVTNLGLNTSSVKTIAAAERDKNRYLIAKTVKAQRRLIWITGLVGMIMCSVLAPILSQTSFGSTDFTWSFVAISIIILLDQVNKGELAVLQGMQQKKQLARANIIGQTLNAIITIPLFYFWGVKAIVAAFVIGSLVSLVISRYYSSKLFFIKVDMSWRETFSYGNEMVKLGFFLSLQFLMATVVVWIIRNYVSNIGGLADVGLYGAGTAIVTSYIGLVFSAIATDYFPRLSATKTNEELGVAVCTQAELSILLLAPLAVVFLVFIKPVIVLLYSEQFLPIENMMYWAIGAVLFQAMGWALSYTLLAKAKPSYFFLNELVSTTWGLPIKLLCYKWWGLTGFGMAILIVYTLYLIQVLFVSKKLFGISYELSLWKLFFLLNLSVVVTVILKLSLPVTLGYVFGSLIILMTGLYSLYKLDKKMDLFSFLKNRIERYGK